LPATLVWHNTGKERKALGLQPVSLDEERICAVSGVAGTYTVKVFCLPGSQQESRQCAWAWTN